MIFCLKACFRCQQSDRMELETTYPPTWWRDPNSSSPLVLTILEHHLISLQHFIVLFLFLFFPELFIDLRSLLNLFLDQNGVEDQWMKREEEVVMWSGSWWFDLHSRVSYLSWILFCWKKIQIHQGIYFRSFTQLLDSSLNSAVTMTKIITVNSAPLFFRIVWLFSCNPWFNVLPISLSWFP